VVKHCVSDAGEAVSGPVAAISNAIVPSVGFSIFSFENTSSNVAQVFLEAIFLTFTGDIFPFFDKNLQTPLMLNEAERLLVPKPVGLTDRELRLKAAGALRIAIAKQLPLNYACRLFVKWPVLLKKLMQRACFPSADDYTCMLARCIEQSLTQSFEILLSFAHRYENPPPLYLLPSVYKINWGMYRQAVETGFYDLYIDNKSLEYDRPTPQEHHKAGCYTGFRHAKHRLQYAPDTFLPIYRKWWDQVGQDCSYDAFTDSNVQQKVFGADCSVGTFV
jgi:hypothetical protein